MKTPEFYRGAIIEAEKAIAVIEETLEKKHQRYHIEITSLNKRLKMYAKAIIEFEKKLEQ